MALIVDNGTHTNINMRSADHGQSAVPFSALALVVILRQARPVHHVNPVKTLPPIPLLSLHVDLIWYSFSSYPIASARARALYVQNAL